MVIVFKGCYTCKTVGTFKFLQSERDSTIFLRTNYYLFNLSFSYSRSYWHNVWYTFCYKMIFTAYEIYYYSIASSLRLHNEFRICFCCISMDKQYEYEIRLGGYRSL